MSFCNTRFPMVVALLVAAGLVWPVSGSPGADGAYRSHPPMRPLPQPSSRPLPNQNVYFVDAEQGDDTSDGSKLSPWKSIRHAQRQLVPGDILCLRGGTYYERLDFLVSGEEGKPIIVRSHPGEVAVIDGGYREFFETPESAWKKPDGPDATTGEFISAREFPEFASRPIVHAFPAAGWEPLYGKEEQRPVVLGFFGDSMVPLHGYRLLGDLRDESMLWDVGEKFNQEEGVYCGPGFWFNRATMRIHVRLAHTNLDGLGGRSYAGVTDPRKIPLVISAPFGADVLRLNGVRHLVFQDIVLRGASSSPLININGAEDVTFDGITAYGGAPSLLIKATKGLNIRHCAFRSLAAPWSSRASMKYRGVPSYVVITQRAQPLNHDFEWSHNEFTDGHDGIWIRYVNNLRFHHNLVENFNDDGVEVGARKGDHELYIYQNRLNSCLLTLTLHEMERDESPAEVDPGSGVFVTRNLIDLRKPIFRRPPVAKGEPVFGAGGALCGDHGGPVWPDYYFYHNTVVRADSAWRGYYAFGMGGRGIRGNNRRIFNNIFVQVAGVPGLNVPKGLEDQEGFFADGNLHWGIGEALGAKEKAHAQLTARRASSDGWMKNDVFADPGFVLRPQLAGPLDLRLGEDSPAINAGVPVPEEWFDPLREDDSGKPDIGALPFE